MASQYDLPYTGPQVETLLAKISELESEMPSKTSDLTNDSGFITSEDVPTKTSDLNNDSGFITNAPVAAEAARAQAAEALLATISSLQAEISRATGVEGTLQDLIDGIAAKIPSAATEQNQLADKAFVNSSIATSTAEFRGTYNSLAELQAVSADENDYGYVRTTDAAGNTVYKRYKYASGSWVFEYDLNNSSFTASQWAAINSAITAELVEKLRALPTNAALTAALAAKQDVIDDLSSIRSKANSAYQKPSGGIPASDMADGVIPDVSGKVNTSDIADNLATNDATKVLSAKQGKVLNENLTQLGQYSRSQRNIGEGKNGPLVYSIVRFVRSQRPYRVYVLTPDWEVTYQGAKLTIGVENVTGKRTNKVTVYYNSVIKSYYDVMTDNDTIALYIGVRAENGKAIDFLVEDYDARKDWGILYDKNNAYVTRVLTSETDPTDNPNGVRIRIVMPVKSGMKTWAKTTDPLGLSCVITPSFAQAIRVAAEDIIEVISSSYIAGYDEKTIQHDGYMTISLTNGGTPITDARKKEMLNALSFCCGEGTMYDNTTIEHRHTDEILNLNNETDALSDTVDTIDDYNNTLCENFIKNGLFGSIDTVIIPSVAQTYNGWFRSGETTNFHDGNEKRLLYYPEVYVKGGELVSVKYSGRNAIRVYELPYRKLGSSPFLTYSTANDIIAYHDLVNNTSSSYTGEVSFKLSDKCFRLGFVLGSTQNVAISPSEITDEITEVTLTVIDTSVLNIANNDFKLKPFIERVAQAKFVAPSGTFTKSLGLIHFSDIHGDQEAADTINAYKKTIYDYVDDMLCTGDSVHYYADGAGSYPHGSVWWKETSNLADKSLFILGNHDSATPATTEYDQIEDSAAWDGKGKDWCYETYFAPYIEQLGYVMPSGYNDPTSANYHACYWHKDYTTQKIRVIGLDCLHRFDGVIDPVTGAITTAGVKWTTNEQELWLIQKLNETLDSNNPAYGFSVLVACHYPIDNFNGNNEEWNDTNHRFTYNTNASGGRVMNHRTNDVVAFHNIKALSYNAEVKFNMRNRIDNGYSQGDPYPNYTQGATNNVGEILNAWIGRGGKMIAWLCGHLHNDYMWYSTTYPNILCIAIDQAGWLRPYGNGDRSEGLLSRTCANYYAFDTQNGLIKIVRIGYNMNKYLVSHEYLCYDYINRKVLNEG